MDDETARWYAATTLHEIPIPTGTYIDLYGVRCLVVGPGGGYGDEVCVPVFFVRRWLDWAIPGLRL